MQDPLAAAGVPPAGDQQGKTPIVSDIANVRLPSYRKWEAQSLVFRKKIGMDFVKCHLQLHSDRLAMYD